MDIFNLKNIRIFYFNTTYLEYAFLYGTILSVLVLFLNIRIYNHATSLAHVSGPFIQNPLVRFHLLLFGFYIIAFSTLFYILILNYVIDPYHVTKSLMGTIYTLFRRLFDQGSYE